MARKSSTTAGKSAGQIIYSLEAGTPIFVTAADICRALGKTKSRISQITGDGIIHKTKTSHGMLYDLFETVKDYCQHIEGSVKKVNEDMAQLDARKKLADAELREAKADMAKLSADELRGKMHRSEDVQAMTADLLFFIRGSITALAGRCAMDCAASSEPAEVQKIIEREVNDILKDLSEYKYDPKRYDELVRQRMKRDALDDEDDEEE
ncbi:MAG: hypothetical protein NC299_08910 [Lachnospiraceae bacterium]|nr:hypothetical protein [Lachnospiraceae bacterium]